MQTPAGRSLPGFAVPINNSSAEHGQSEAEAILNLSLLKFQIAGQNQVQLGGRFCHKAAALVEDGLSSVLRARRPLPAVRLSSA